MAAAAAGAGLVLLLLLWMVAEAAGRGSTVTCRRREECVLPCQFQSDGRGARIMWYKRKAVVSCTRYGNTSFVVGHNSPAEKYVGRTGLYADRVLEGNATLLLHDVTPHDEGKYFCITMTAPRTDESNVITLVVKAPVEQVAMEFSGDAVTCRAEDVYPAPALTWSTDPSADARVLLRNKTRIWRTKLGFYVVESSLVLADDEDGGGENQTFSCSVTSDGSTKAAHLKREASIQVQEGDGVQLPCRFPHGVPLSFNLTWRFQRSDTVLLMRVGGGGGGRSHVTVWDRWRPHVVDGHAASHALKLRSLRMEHQGAFTCEVDTPEETFITRTDVIVTSGSKWRFYIVIAVLSFLLYVGYMLVAVLSYNVIRLKERNRSAASGSVQETSETDGGETDG